jgi:glutamate formiminotransferase / formiminotetrahydrofolate cyclodeaminase
MKKIIECIPNFSEGQNPKTIEAIVSVIKAVPKVFLLDHESDGDHNRSVVTFAGEPGAVIEAAFQAIKKASELIDLNKHKGEHPRMGATDVCPLVPIKGVKEAECIEYAKTLGARVGKELKIPVYLYEKAAQKEGRENLANVRKGQYEGIKAEIGKDPSRKPDFGPSKLGSAGATAVGVRIPLLAYNVNLATDNLKIAQSIAKTIRHKTGGFAYVKALGFALEDKGIVQVSMNLTNYKKSAVHTVFESIKREAHRYGVNVLESEVIGLIPQAALNKAAEYYLQIDGLKNRQILESAIQKQVERNTVTLDGFLEKTASKKPVPGGGSVAALAGALAGALSSMVANLTLAREKYKKSHPEMEKALRKTETLRLRLYELIKEDSDAYKQVVKAYKEGKESTIQKATKIAAQTPLEIAQTAVKLLDPLKILSEKGNPNAITDCGVAAHMVEAAVKGAILNVRINLKDLKNKTFVKELSEECEKLKLSLEKKVTKIEETVESKL